ncbi:MAG TPA: bifunctional N(6)-L-threonylcarbamoyladenine synthase/serine/threonine protein kinase [Candidatus Nanoarchaeia archaeon]|nr:bifunctional N(6)-L-threonylcarbamoyladenine synthase/serine/threonine protein kinase [Candidatus Nanoarchaeia archaeon]
MKLILGIETTAHTFGVGIVTDKGEVLANSKDSFTTTHGGMIPAEVGEHHFDVWQKVLDDALHEAKIKLNDVDVFSYSRGPGIGNCLRVGAFVARCLALKYKKPLVGVNHCIAHLSIGALRTKAKDPILLYASGANTQVIAFQAGKYRVFGETLDQGVGNFIDSAARELGLGFPGGPLLEKLAAHGKNFIELPYTVKGMDVSFGGLFTNVKQKIDSKKFTKEDIAFSIQETVFAMLVEVAERALAHTGKKELVLGGGVACNARLQEMCRMMCDERGAQSFCPEREFLTDNGAMIAWQGWLECKAGKKDKISDKILPYWRTDDVDVEWL